MNDTSPVDPTLGLPLRPGESVFGCLQRLERESMDAVPFEQPEPVDLTQTQYRIVHPKWISDRQDPVGCWLDLLEYVRVYFGAFIDLSQGTDSNGRAHLRLPDGTVFATQID